MRLHPTHGFSRVLAPSELWRYREVALQIAVRDVTVRYRQTLLGAAWAVLQPVLTMVVFTVIFGHLAHVPSEGKAYAVFRLLRAGAMDVLRQCADLGSDEPDQQLGAGVQDLLSAHLHPGGSAVRRSRGPRRSLSWC